MSKRNGYFQIHILEKVTFVRLHPPVDGGDPIMPEELRDYLVAKGYNVDVVLLKHAIDAAADEPKDLKLADKKGIPVSESVNIKVLPDKMTAIGRFYPFSSAGAAFTLEDIKKELNFAGIKFGIKESEINRFLQDKYYCTDYILAKGQLPTEGKDASIEYFFNTNPNLKPKLNEDGSVDFFSLSAISQVNAGDKLATLTPEVEGRNGYDIFGEPIPPKDVRKLTLKHGRGISESEDGLSIISDVNGHATLVDGQVFVSEVYEVSDVDTATGNIDYEGNVCVLGNVKAGYILKAKGDIEIRGVVEGALVEATGNITIARGMNGMGKGILKAGGNIISKFLENTNVSCEGYIHAEAILHSTISCKGDVEVTGKKGFITGGIVRSRGIVSCKTIGSTMGVDTIIEVGSDPALTLKMNNLNQLIAQKQKRFEAVEQVYVTIARRIRSGDKLTPDQMRYFKQLSVEYGSLKTEIASLDEEITELTQQLDNTQVESYVKVSEFAYPGTKISINDVSRMFTKSVQHARIVKDGADIRVKGY